MKQTYQRDWVSYNRKLIHRGELLIPIDLMKQSKRELKIMNHGKEGSPFKYPNILMECLGLWKCFYKLPYRAVDELARNLLHSFGLGVASATPNYTTIYRRLIQLGKKYYSERKCDKSKKIYAIFDGSGLKVTNRGEWMHYKHKGKHKGFVRICFMIDGNTGEVIEFSATTENVAEQKKIRPMLKRAAEHHRIGKFAVDGIGDDWRNFELLKQLKIKPAIKLRANANPLQLEYYPEKIERLKEVRKFKQWGYEHWAKLRDYGQRWQVETGFACFKEYLGEYVTSRRMQYIKAEVGLKVHYYNQLRLG